MRSKQHSKQHRFSLSTLKTAIQIATLGTIASMPLQAWAQANTPHAVNIPAQSLSSALQQFGQQTGLQVIYNAELVKGLQSPGAQGSLEPKEALVQLLKDARINFTISGNTVTLVAASPTGKLGPVKVVASELGATTEGTGSYTTGAMNSATKLVLSIRQTPQTVSVISQQQIQDQGLEDLNGVAKQIPGINYSQADSERFSFYARGFEISSYMVDGVQTSSHPDGAYQPFYRSGMDMAIYDRIEVVKGATGLITGAGSPAASINLFKKRPTSEFQASVTGSAGSWDSYRTTGDVSSPLNESGSVRGRVVGVYEDKEYFIDYYQSEQSTVYGIVEADLTDATLLSVSVVHSDNDINGMAWGGAFPAFYSDGTRTDFPRSFSQGDDWTSWSAKSTTTQVDLAHNFNEDWQLKLIYNDQKNESELFSIFYEGQPTPAGGVLLYRDEYPNTIDRDVITADLTGKFEFLGRQHDLMFGVTKTDTHYDGDNYIDWDGYYTADFVKSAGNIPQLDHSARLLDETLIADIEEQAAYAAARFHLLDSLAVIAGARISDWSYDGDTIRGTKTTDVIYDFDRVVSPYFGAVYDLNSSLSVYASYTDIFTPQNAKNRNLELIDPINGEAYEAGIKGEFNDGKVNASAAVFQITQDNYAEATGVIISGQPIYEALEGATSTGIEFEVSGEISPNWNLHGGVSHSKIEDANNNPVLTTSAENTIAVFTTYRLPILSERLTIGGGAKWQDDVYKDKVGPDNDKIAGTADDRMAQDSYALVDIFAKYKFSDHLSASLNVDNVFDKTYYSAFRQGSQYGLPRSVKVTVKYSF